MAPSFALALVAYLWITGGLGWASGYEQQLPPGTMSRAGRVIIVALWPFMAGVALQEYAWANGARLVRRMRAGGG